jgi:hypothetical protein
MIAQGFKPVGWVAAVAGAALGCYMLSLNVASERAELAKIERQIIAAKQEIRTLQTELGTRGRMQQLEHWNAEVLALSAPTASQFLENPMTLARFETKEPTLEDKARVTMAAAQVKAPAPRPEIAAGRKLSPADYAKVAERAAAAPQPKVRLAAAVVGGDDKLAARVVKAAAVKLPEEIRPAIKPSSSSAAKAPAKADPKAPSDAPIIKVASKAAEAKTANVEANPKKADVKKPEAKKVEAKKGEAVKTGAGA